MKVYDEKKDRLIAIRTRADKTFWDEHWDSFDLESYIKSGEKGWLVRKITKKFLKPGDKVLDAGSGLGQNVYGFDAWGFEGYGVQKMRYIGNTSVFTDNNAK